MEKISLQKLMKGDKFSFFKTVKLVKLPDLGDSLISNAEAHYFYIFEDGKN